MPPETINQVLLRTAIAYADIQVQGYVHDLEAAVEASRQLIAQAEADGTIAQVPVESLAQVEAALAALQRVA
jgi:hypothetical protein